MSTVDKIVATLAASVPMALLRGYVVSQLWLWFVLDAFPGTPQLGVVNAVGMSFIVVLITANRAEPAEKRKLREVMISSCFMSLLCWGMGYLWYVAR